MLYPATCVRLRYGPHESWMIAGFLGGPDGTLFRLAARALLCRVITPSAFNRLFRQAAVPGGPRHRVSSHAGAGILTGRPSPYASRLRLRTRLTLARHASARKPWPYGGEETLLPYRYLYLHLLFQSLQKGSSPLLSMQARSTSELLRTLQMDGCFQANILAVSAGPPRLANSATSSGP